LDIAVMRSRHVMAGDKASKEMFGIPEQRKNIRGTSVESDIIELEQLLHSAYVFCAHTPVIMTRDFFFNLVKPKTGVGSPRDICKTTVAFDEHETEMNCRVFTGNIICDDEVHPYDQLQEDGVGFLRDDMSAVSNDETIGANSMSSAAVRVDDMDSNDDDDNDDDVFFSQEDRDKALEAAMRKLGNMHRKPLNKYAVIDPFARGHLLLGGMAKQRKISRDKVESKRALIHQSLKYFGSQMEQRRTRLEECMIRSTDESFMYNMPRWKRNFKDHIKQLLGKD
jgi:hypothetical protein